MRSSAAATNTAIEPSALEAMNWRQRRRSVAAAIANWREQPEHTRQLIEGLCEDPAWQVRKELAEHLVNLDDDMLARCAGRLADDGNRFVVEAVQRSLDRRRKGARDSKRRARAHTELDGLVAAFERRHGAQAARQMRCLADRLYDVVVGATVHELRGLITPLADVLVTLQGQLETGRVDQAWIGRHLPRIRSRMDLVMQVLDDMREFSRATPATRRPEALVPLCHEAVALTRDWYQAFGIDTQPVTIAIDAEAGVLAEVARHQILIALRNLVKNAVDSLLDWPRKMLQPGQVLIRVRHLRAEHLAEITVTDTGSGLRPDDLERLRQFRPGHTSKKDYGTGFGLPIAYRKARDHGGSLQIDSQPGAGTQVRLLLPLTADCLEDAQS